jgi:hypothetical protein
VVVVVFKLADSLGSRQGVYCGREGLYLGSAALIERRDGRYCVRAEDEVAALLAAAYGPGHGTAELLARLRLIATRLNDANLTAAMISAVHLRLDEIGEDGIARVIRTEALLKANFDPAQPRDDHGRWTADGGNSGDRETGAAGPPALRPAQEVLPFLARPPFFLEDPPKTVRPFRKPLPRLSGKEGSKDIPSWARGKRPYVGENGGDYAQRLMDDQYGRGDWEKNDPEYRQLKKHGDRNFRDTMPIFRPDDEGSI